MDNNTKEFIILIAGLIIGYIGSSNLVSFLVNAVISIFNIDIATNVKNFDSIYRTIILIIGIILMFIGGFKINKTNS